MKTRVHLHLPVRNLDAALGFYTRLFGAAPSKRKPGYANFRLDTPALHLALTEAPAATGGAHHFGVELFSLETLSRERQRVEAAGLKLRIENEVTCCHAVGEKFWARDPDGNEWEFWVRLADAEEAGKPAGESACCAPDAPQACCAVAETACCA